MLEYDACNFRPFQGQQSKNNLLVYFYFILSITQIYEISISYKETAFEEKNCKIERFEINSNVPFVFL